MPQRQRRIHPLAVASLAGGLFAAVLGVYAVTWQISAAPLDAREAAESASFDDPALNAETKRRGEAIAAAIERYRADKGRCPASLDMLVPEFLAEVPPPVAGMPAWRYHIDPARDTYTIAFGIGDDCYPCSWYPSGVPDVAGWYDDG